MVYLQWDLALTEDRHFQFTDSSISAGCGSVRPGTPGGHCSMKSLGKLLQIAGLVLLPLAMLMEISDLLSRRGVAEMLLMLIAGAAAFGLGRLIEGYAR